MDTRRGFLAVLGGAAFAGCSTTKGDQESTQTRTTAETTTRTTTETMTQTTSQEDSTTTSQYSGQQAREILREQHPMSENDENLEWMLSGDPRGFPDGEIESILEGETTSSKPAEYQLGESLMEYASNYESTTAAIAGLGKEIQLLREEHDIDDNFYLIKNWVSGGNSGIAGNIAKVTEKDGEPHMNPFVVASPEIGMIDGPENPHPKYSALRNSSNWNTMVAQDQKGIDHILSETNGSQKDIEEFKAMMYNAQGHAVGGPDNPNAVLSPVSAKEFFRVGYQEGGPLEVVAGTGAAYEPDNTNTEWSLLDYSGQWRQRALPNFNPREGLSS